MPFYQGCKHNGTNYTTFDLWTCCVIEWIPKIRYVGGWRTILSDINIDEFFYDDIIAMYKRAGGKSSIIEVYYSLPGKSLDDEIHKLEWDNNIIELQNVYKGLPVISLYIEDKPSPYLNIDLENNELQIQEEMQNFSHHMDDKFNYGIDNVNPEIERAEY